MLTPPARGSVSYRSRIQAFPRTGCSALILNLSPSEYATASYFSATLAVFWGNVGGRIPSVEVLEQEGQKRMFEDSLEPRMVGGRKEISCGNSNRLQLEIFGVF